MLRRAAFLAVAVDTGIHSKILASFKASEERRKAKLAAAGKGSPTDSTSDVQHTLVELFVSLPDTALPR